MKTTVQLHIGRISSNDQSVDGKMYLEINDQKSGKRIMQMCLSAEQFLDLLSTRHPQTEADVWLSDDIGKHRLAQVFHAPNPPKGENHENWFTDPATPWGATAAALIEQGYRYEGHSRTTGGNSRVVFVKYVDSIEEQ